MGVDKVASKSSTGGFFNLFDWNRKSLKKLLSHRNGSLGRKLLENGEDGTLSESIDNVNEDETVGVSETKGSTYSCGSSSLTDDEEKSSIRGPGVVAKLMGLDFMPTSGLSEPCSTPFCDSVSTIDDISDISNHSNHLNRNDVFPPLELRFSKLPATPLERFRMEPLPPRWVKPIPVSQHKLLSPVRSPRLSSISDASRIIEAAAKMLEPELYSGNMPQSRSSNPPSRPLSVGNSREIIRTKKISKFVEPTTKPIESGVRKSLGGEASNGSSFRLENSAALRSFSHASLDRSAGAKGKNKAVSPAAQTKLNFQGREGSSTKSGNGLGLKSSAVSNLNKTSYEAVSQKHNKHNRSLKTNASEVLRPNSQKQNYDPEKNNLAVKSFAHNQEGSRSLLGNSSRQNKVTNKISRNRNSGLSKGGSQTTKTGKERFPLKDNSITQNKRLVEPSSSSERTRPMDNMRVARHGKQVRHIIVLDENAKPNNVDSRNSSDVVSFTFTSPMKKSIHFVDNVAINGRQNGYNDTHCRDNVDIIGEDSSSQVYAEASDSLGILIERKLRELHCGGQSPYCKIISGQSGPDTSLSFSSSASNINVNHEEDKVELIFRYDDEVDDCFPSTSLTNDWESFISRTLKEDGTDRCSSTQFLKELDHQSPLSILEKSFSNESCSSESCECRTGSKANCSSIMPEELVNSNIMKRIFLLDQTSEISESVSVKSVETRDGALDEELSQEFHHNHSGNVEVDYVREILIHQELMFGNFILSPLVNPSGVLSPVIFDKLEESISFITADEGEEKDCRTSRKMLFDSVNEYLEMQLTCYFQAGYRAWEKGINVIKKDLAKDIYEEISGWTGNVDWMVDELVKKDMSTNLGKWTNFDIESFANGVEIEIVILNWLIDEVVTELM